ncbi:unnamed protein product [Acanthoscelides obtectus]|uniref:Uncharacterized protein n=1 Tax=Acanthoscelides obtectus TaxID=200917 RepID=A0A9P0KNL0_ACAOB|nr:unnamed protein product [Acanthoscelides obtectus]CAK1685062.1 hypothetical protein AOBTE_LOCUS35216 [Acanthoscelides obtectus]
MEIDMQQLVTSVTQNLSEDMAATEMEVIAFQNDLALKSLFPIQNVSGLQ